MKKVLTFSGVLVALVLVGASCQQAATSTTDTTNAAEDAAVTTNSSVEDDMMVDDAAMEDDAMMDDGEAMDEGDSMEMEKDEEMTEDSMEEEGMMEDGESEGAPDTTAAGGGTYTSYSASQVASAATAGDAVLFFHAPWCPTCAALNTNIEENAAEIPAGLTIFKTDYDSELELRKKYGVTYQHTLVQVDADGNMITKWSGGNTLDSIVSKVQ